jgi:LCP family protein required for cell wall assembly
VRRLRRVWLVVGVAFAVLIAAVGGYLWFLNNEVNRVKVRDLSHAPSTGAELGTQNILLVGSTSRCALKTQNPAFGLCDQGVTGVNSDVVMILHLDPTRHRASILSIPRDTFVPNARAEGANKIDAALAEGPNQLVDAIQEDFGIPIQHYVELNFDTFAGVVNAVGGVRMYFPMPVFDAESGLRVLTPGCRLLNGFQALAVVRARHLQYKAAGVTTDNYRLWPQEAESDLARIRRDHEFLRVLASTVKKRGLSNPIVDQQLAASVAPDLEVDSGLSAVGLAQLILEFHGLNPYSAPELTVPVAVTTFGSYIYKGGDYGDVVFPTEPQDQTVIDEFLGVGPQTNTMNGDPLPSAGSVRVSVENATGTAGQARSAAAALQALGFRVVGTGDVPPVGQYAETVVAYAGPAEEAAAQAVERKLSGYVTLAQDPSLVTPGAQVTVVTGTSIAVARPAKPAAHPSAGASSSAPSAPTASSPAPAPPAAAPSASGFTAPSAAVENLAPWDPRSCSATGGPGP